MRPDRRRWGVLGAVVAAGLLGCQAPGIQSAAAVLAPQERLELEGRALDLLLRAAQSDDPVVVANALEALVKVAPRDGRPAFRQATRAELPLVRFAGLMALGDVRDAESLPLMTAAAQDAHALVRLAGAYAACRCGKDGYARVLMRALTDAPEENLRAEAAHLLGRLGEPRACKWLRVARELAANKKSRRVDLAINGALARLGDEDGLPQLVVYSRGDAATRAEALLILAELDYRDAREDLLFALVGPEEEYLEARLIAARGLGKLGYREGYDLALRMLEYTDPNPAPTPDNPDRTFTVRSLAVHALAEIGDARALAPLRELAADQGDPRLQVAASYAVCRILSR